MKLNLLNQNNERNSFEMFKSIKDAKKNIEKILKEEKNDEIINDHENIVEENEVNI